MTRYRVFEPPVGADEARPSDRAVFVRDAFSRWAVVFPYLWLWRHRLILAGFCALAGVIILAEAAERAGLGFAAVVLPLLLGTLVGLEGPSLRAARYRRRGFEEVAVVEADDEDEAAILYYAEALPEPVAPAAASPRAAAPRPGRDLFTTGLR